MSQIISWSASRLEKYAQCPLKAKLELVDKLCPLCFEGKISGGFDGKPVVCDTCGGTVKQHDALKRGSEIGENLEKYVTGSTATLHHEITNPKVKALAKTLRTDFKKKLVRVELEIVLDKSWQPVSKFTKGAWFRGRLDVLRFLKDPTKAVVIDWKTGGVDKRTKEIRVESKYDDQLAIYSTVALVAFPQVEKVEAQLAFTDARDDLDPVLVRPESYLSRPGLERLKKQWEKKIKPMMNDTVFAPRASDKCGWCEFRKGRGGPCPY